MILPNQFRVSAPRLDRGLCRYCADHEGEARVLAAIAMAQQRGARWLARCPPHVVCCIRRAGCNKRAPTAAWLQVINFYCALLQRDIARNAAAPRCAPSGLGSPPPHHICAGTGPTPPTSALRLGSALPHLRRDWAVPLPHLRRDWAPRLRRQDRRSIGWPYYEALWALRVACRMPCSTLYARLHTGMPDGTLHARWHAVRCAAGHFMSSHFFSKLTARGYDYAGVRRWTKKLKVPHLPCDWARCCHGT